MPAVTARTVIAALSCLVLLASCGIPAEDAPRDISAPNGRFDAASAPPPSTGTAGSVDETLYLIRESRLTAVRRGVTVYPTLEEHLRHLIAGPAAVEQRAGYSSALTGSTTIGAARSNGAEAVVSVGDPPDDSGRSDEALAFGQIVCTLAARPDTAVVSFERDGVPLGVPRADGSLTEGALTCADYAGLTASG